MRKSIAFAFVAALCVTGCSQQQSTSSRVHPSAPAASGAQALALAQAAVAPGDPHAVDRATTASDYCVACHSWADDQNNHPVRVSYLISASGGGYLTPDPAIVLREGVWVECSSCHDDGSAGFPKRTVLQDLCSGCHDKDSTASPPYVNLASPAAGATLSGAIVITASASGAVRTELWGGPSAYETTLLASVATGGDVTFPVDSTALANGPYVFLVRGYDEAGANLSSYVTVSVSNVPPFVVAIQSPVTGTVVGGTISVVAQSPGAVSAELFAAGSLRATATPVGDTLTFALDTMPLVNGTQSLTVRAVDVSGRFADATTSVVVDNPHPPVDVWIQSPATNSLARGTIQVLATTVNAAGTAELWMLREVGDGVIVATAPVQADGSVAFSLDTAAYADGWALLTVQVYDAWGGAAFRSAGVIFDNTGPAVALTSPPSGATIRSTMTLTATASDANGVASVAFYVDGALLGTSTEAPYAVAWTPERRSGSHTLTAVATDASGNTATSAPVIVIAK